MGERMCQSFKSRTRTAQLHEITGFQEIENSVGLRLFFFLIVGVYLTTIFALATKYYKSCVWEEF